MNVFVVMAQHVNGGFYIDSIWKDMHKAVEKVCEIKKHFYYDAWVEQQKVQE